ncbi:IS3 family transposase [Bacillus sp. USDA818B3_A]|uniref:IS3 family transposase n=1 Tax=Bacillus sp. USDA818B3_A TaxID=2698834 RepID=UPI00136BAF70
MAKHSEQFKLMIVRTSYGYRRIKLKLKKRGNKLNHKKLQRVMNKLRLKGDKFRATKSVLMNGLWDRGGQLLSGGESR